MQALNTVSKRVLGEEKYPALHLSAEDTGERFGLEYTEPECRPVPLDWDKHKTRKDTGHTSSPSVPTPPPASETARISSTAPTRLFSFPSPRAALPVTPAITTSSADADKAAGSLSVTEPQLKSELISPCDLGVTLHEAASTSDSASLPVRSSPSSARTGPVKTGGRVFVLDHRRWPAPMKTAIDDLLNKHRGQKDMLKLVDQEYADLVYSSSTDPNSMLHPTTKSLTAGSTTTTVPVVVMPPAAVNPSPPALTVTPPLSQETLEKIVQGIVEKQQQQPPPAPLKKPHTKKCLSCGQPKSKYEGDGSSIHEFYQQGPVRYFYCSTKVFNTYGAEGLTDPRMPFKDFVATEFFQRELEATRQRVEERQQQKRKREESPAPGRKCRFCKLELKQGPNSPHIHTSFPGLPGKYIYCPAKVFSVYREQGMEREMSWNSSSSLPSMRRRRKDQRAGGQKRFSLVPPLTEVMQRSPFVTCTLHLCLQTQDPTDDLFHWLKHQLSRAQNSPSLGGLEPPTFRLTAERANRLRHRDCSNESNPASHAAGENSTIEPPMQERSIYDGHWGMGMGKHQKKRYKSQQITLSGNRTPVSRVTGGDMAKN
ncbi:hypothetical protein WMY93_032121 [Mugilogobius chulae]|uniref:Uncharacterized protein n=1 Tax=Mugilogobius chulae TaxID=88201 RepID=A0AAW0MEZ8_9GOBI